MEEMNNEVMMDTVNEVTDMVTTDIQEGGKDISKVGIIGAGVVVLAGGIALLVRKTKLKDKITERRIAKLEKSGYKVTKEESEEPLEADSVEDSKK